MNKVQKQNGRNLFLRFFLIIALSAGNMLYAEADSVTNIDASGIFLNCGVRTMYAGDTYLLKAVSLNNGQEVLSWQSDNETAAKVNESGSITALSTGTAHITVTQGTTSAACMVEVLPLVTKGVKLNRTGISFSSTGSTKTLTAETVGVEENTGVVWQSSNESVASVSVGKVTANGQGTVDITASLENDDMASKAVCKVIVGVVNAYDYFSEQTNTASDLWQYMYAPKGSTGQWSAYDSVANSGKANAMWYEDGDNSYVNGGVMAYAQLPGKNYDSARVFNAPATGRLKIAISKDPNASLFVDAGYAANFKILKEDEQIFPTDAQWLKLENKTDSNGIRPFQNLSDEALYVDVHKGDTIRFVLSSVEGMPRATVYSYFGGMYASYTNDTVTESLQCSPGLAKFCVGDVYTLPVTAVPDNTALTYYSSNSAIADVAVNGTVSGVASGQCTIYIFDSGHRLAEQCDVSILSEPQDDANIKGTSVGMLTDSAITHIPRGTTMEQLQAALSVRNGATFAFYESDGITIAKELKNYDKCIVTAADGITKKTYTILYVANIVLNKGYISIENGKTKKINASETPFINSTITWSSSNETAAKVDETGNVTAVGEGVAFVSATNGDVSAVCTVEVLSYVTRGVKLNRTGISFPSTGSTKTLTAETVGVEENTGIAWKSSNESVASVSAGKVTANRQGTTDITAFLENDDTAQKAVCKVIVGAVNAYDSFLEQTNTADDLWQYMYAPKSSTGLWSAYNSVANSGTGNAMWYENGDNSYVNGGIMSFAQIPGENYDSARVFNAPATGRLKIALSQDPNASLSVEDAGYAANFKILKGDEQIFPTDAQWLKLEKQTDSNGIRPFQNLSGEALYVNVNKGDAIRFVLSSVEGMPRATVYSYHGGMYISYTSDELSDGIEFDKTELSIKEGQRDMLNAVVIGGNTPVAYSSSDQSVATVDLNGHVAGVSMGQCKIYASTMDGALIDVCNVTVNQADLKIGKPLVTMDATNNLNTKVNVICNTDNLCATLIVVTRNEKGKAENVMVSEKYILNVGDKKTLEVNVGVNNIVKTVDVFVWDSITGLKPLTDVCSYYYPVD